jgi:RHS repeat-associated protein
MVAAGLPVLGGVDPARLHLAHEVGVDQRTGRPVVRVPLDVAAGRNHFGPRLALRYDSCGASSVWGTGWALDGLLSIDVSTRLRDPRYDGRDGYISAVTGELVPALVAQGEDWVPRVETRPGFTVRHWCSRRESAQVRVEQWTQDGTGRVHWRSRDAAGVLSVYGRDDAARIADPVDPTRVFSWLVQEQYDPDGNAILFEYAPESLDGVDTGTTFERSRRVPALAQRYLRRVRYGNSVPLSADQPVPAGTRWHFQVVLDYGDHAADGPEPDRAWPARPDAFSTYRPGFEVRSYRLARRVLCFHDFDPLGPAPVLVGAYRLEHEQRATGCVLTGIGYTGYGPAGTSRDLPPLRLSYTSPVPDGDFTGAPAEAAVNTPGGLGLGHRFLDLYGEGLSGILTETESAWYYKSNVGGGRFGPQNLVAQRPGYRLNQVALSDFDADGNPNLAVLHGRGGGYYTFDRDAQAWLGFQPFDALPHLEAAGRRAQWLDVNGDGRAELLLADAERVVWYPSLGTEGFGAPVTARLPDRGGDGAPPLGEEPALDYFLADMTGDGAVDQVRVRNGRVEYWPQLGNGEFGPGVLMQDAPVFAADHEFDASRLLLVDLDGDGAADLLYLGRHGIHWWRNVSGNSIADGGELAPGVVVDNVSSVSVLDFLGDGTPCLVWSSPLPGTPDELRYARLTGGIRPNLLVGLDNGAGTAHTLAYQSSGTSYLDDLAAGRAWRTRLPMHHPVVVRHEVADLIGGASSATRYAYHDGRYDAAERLMVFAAVEAVDADLPGPDDPVAETAPACVRTWYHNGVDPTGPAGSALSGAYQGDPDAVWLPGHTVTGLADLAPGEYEQAVAAAAGSVLREEVFRVGTDGTPAAHPLQVTQYGYLVTRLQPGLAGRDPALRVHLSQRMTLRYEQLPADPRINHDLVLEVDAYGVPATSVAVGYPRRAGQPGVLPEQQVPLLDLTVAEHSHVDTADRYELTIPVQRKEYELTGVVPAGAAFGLAELSGLVQTALANPGKAAGPATRLIGWRQSYYWDAAGAAALPLGQVGPRTLTHHAESAVFDPAALAEAYAGLAGGIGDGMLTAAGYTNRDGYWWRPEHVCHYRDAAGFHLPDRTVRGDGATTALEYDPANLVPVRLTDPTGAQTVSEVDYRHLEPFRVTDANGAVEEVLLDPLGVAVVTTSYGALAGQAYGQDPLSVYQPVADASPDAALADPAGCVQTASSYVAYELGWSAGGRPPRVVHLLREDLAHDGTGAPAAGQGAGPGAGPGASRIGVRVSHHDGFGRPLQNKELVEPGPAIARDGAGKLILAGDGTPVQQPADPRWRCSGHLRYNRKQQPVREYDPFYTGTAGYEAEPELATFGTVMVTGYDPTGRVVRVDRPDGTFLSTVYTGWTVTRSDENDTVLDSGYRLLREHLPATDPQRQAYDAAAAHANTPVVTHLDPAGLAVREVQVAAGGTDLVTQVRRDAHGAERELVDARGITTHRYIRDLAGRPLREDSADAGTGWLLPDAYDRVTDAWNQRGVHLRSGYDLADRLVFADVDGLGLNHRVQSIVYGDDPSVPDGAARNAIGRPVVHRDQAGTRTVERYNPAGAELRATRQFRSDVDGEPDWRQPVPLEPETFTSEHEMDALGRVRAQRLPDGSTRSLTYLAGGGLDRVTMSTSDGKVSDLVLIDGTETTARGQRGRLRLGNGVEVVHAFDPETARTTRITSSRAGTAMQDIEYTYDPVGNVVRAEDHAQAPGGPVLPGLTVTPEALYTYDEFYQLVQASGRVHQALLQHDYRPGAPGADAMKGTRHLAFNNAAAVERYQRSYRYDANGNLTQIKHLGASQQWTTDLWVAPDSNRSVPTMDPAGNPVSDPAGHFDAAGNCVALAHLRALEWTYRDAIARAVTVDRSGTGQPDDDERYVYDDAGMRVRKVARRLVSGAVEETEKLYLDGCEIVRVRAAGTLVLERITSHVSDERAVVAYVHRWSTDAAQRETDDLAAARVRYPLVDHLGSAQLEVDQAGAVISYEEYFPFGGTSFVAGDAVREVRMRDYRFCGKECDDATGLYYFGHRYYAPWLGRWLSADPIGPADDPNRYRYVRNNPVCLVDPDGLQSTGTVHTYVTPTVPPELGVSLTPAEIAKWNRGQLVLVRMPGSSTVEKLTVSQYRARVREYVASGGTVSAAHVVPQKTKPKAPSKQDKPAEPPPDDAVTAADGDPDAGGGLGDAAGGDPGTGNAKGSGSATSPGGGENGQDGTGGGAANPGGTGGGDSGGSSAHDNGGTGVHTGDGGSGQGNSPTGGAGGGNAGSGGAGTTDGTGSGTGTGSAAGGTGSGSGGGTGTGNGTGTVPGTKGATGKGTGTRPGTGTGSGTGGGTGTGKGTGTQSGGSGPGDPDGVAGGDEHGQRGGAIGGGAGGDLRGQLGGSENGTLTGRGHGGNDDAPPTNPVPPPNGQTSKGQDQRGGRGAANGTGTGNGTDPGNGKGQGTGNNPGGTGQGQRSEHPSGATGGGVGGSGSGSSQGGSGAVTPGGSGTQSGTGSGTGEGPAGPHDDWDTATRVAGYFDLQFGNDEGGQAGGIPGGAGFLKGHWAQALYIALVAVQTVLAVVAAVKYVAQVGVRGTLTGLRGVWNWARRIFTRRYWAEVVEHELYRLSRFSWRQLPRRMARFFYDGREWGSISKDYWKGRAGRFSQNLHHWLIPRKLSRGRWFEGFANAGWNLFATSARLNGYMDWPYARFSGKWFVSRYVKYVGVPSFLGHVAAGSSYVGTRIGEWLTGQSGAPANPRTPAATPAP